MGIHGGLTIWAASPRTLWGSISGSGLGGMLAWDHRGVIISVVYLLVHCLLRVHGP